MRKYFSLLLLGLSFFVTLSASAAEPQVARSILTSGVVEREPVDELEQVPPGSESVVYFTDLRHMSDKTVTHIWKHEGEEVARIKFEVGGPRWRVWSSKELTPMLSGQWEIVVEDSWGNIYAEERFDYTGADETAVR